jgi:CheY-like chemotaxis protein
MLQPAMKRVDGTRDVPAVACEPQNMDLKHGRLGWDSPCRREPVRGENGSGAPAPNPAHIGHGFCASRAFGSEDPKAKPGGQIRPLVNQFLETRSGDKPTSSEDLHTFGATGAGDQCAAEKVSAAPAHVGRVLLLEDDASFREIIRDTLSENGYTVVAVQNGADGVREVLAADFTAVICDFMMPSLSGDLFYRAVEKIRPALCQRFVFMTGHHNEAKTTEFVNQTNVFMLRKPFRMEALLDSIAVAEACCMFQSVFASPTAEPVHSRGGLPAGKAPPVASRHSDESALSGKVGTILGRAQAPQRSDVQSDASTGREPAHRAGGGYGATVFAVFALLLAAGAGLWYEYQNARSRLDAVATERLALDAELAAISPHLEEAISERSQNETDQEQLARLSADRAKPHWTPALRFVVPPADGRIDILDVTARAVAAAPGVFEVRVHGLAHGAEPRLSADRFRQTFEEELTRSGFGLPVSAKFDRLEDADAVVPGEKRVDFVMLAKLGSTKPSLAAGKGGR